jgi:hypothetical protein
MVRSQVGITTRNLEHANQAQNNSVARPAIVGPLPQSHWAQYAAPATMRRRLNRRP